MLPYHADNRKVITLLPLLVRRAGFVLKGTVILVLPME